MMLGSSRKHEAVWRGRRRRPVLHVFLATCGISVVTMSFYYYFLLFAPTIRVIPPAPPRLQWNPTVENDRSLAVLEFLSSQLYSQIEKISSSNCSQGFTLQCGHFDVCGLGCQLHHRATCIMLSYSMGMPLIHDANKGWAYDAPWDHIFQPLGSSNCVSNERTLKVEWNFGMTPRLVFSRKTDSNEIVQYPFESGIPVDDEFFRLLQDNHPNPFLWFVGQCLKYTMRLSPEIAVEVEHWLSSLHKYRPLYGFHIRRTDKIQEANYHELEEYMDPLEAYLKSSTNGEDSPPHTVYIASDDHTVLKQAQERYSPQKWRFIGQNTSETLWDQRSRSPVRALISTIKDILVLAKCDFVVCTFSSNMCRLVYELLHADRVGADDRFKSIDEYYRYLLAGHVVPPALIPVHPSETPRGHIQQLLEQPLTHSGVITTAA